MNDEAVSIDYFTPFPASNSDTGQSLLASQNLLDRNGCTTCHAINEQTIGPSFRQISRKYGSHPDLATLKKLAQKVSEGGQGVWGNVPMIPHP
ncbi:UNVERIFIED_CONTAM: hypothetical protein GTU68_040815, partial [Idotea baltica]|nr:hypothetical protein [Idotea baltica]